MKKLIFLNILFLSILSGCIIPKNETTEEKPFVLKYLKKFGTLYHTELSGRRSDVFGFYTNDLNLKINLVTFIGKNKRKETNHSISINEERKNIYKDYKILFFSFEERDIYEIEEIILETSRGKYFTKTNISSKKPPISLYNPNDDRIVIDTMYTANSINLYPQHIDYLFFKFYSGNYIVEITNISLFEKENFPADLKVTEIFLNNALFKKNEKKYIFVNTSVEINVKLSYFPMGNYSFKIEYIIDEKKYESLSVPIILDHISGENLNDNHTKLTDAYFNGDFSVEFQPLV